MEQSITRHGLDTSRLDSIRQFHNRVQAGLSLADLTIALAVTAIVLTLGIPSFAQIIDQTRLQTATDQLTADIAVARAAAISRATLVVMCSSNDGRSCSGEKDWGSGWIVFKDEDGDMAPSEDADDQMIRIMESPVHGVIIGGNHAHFRYLPDGTMQAL